MGFTYRCLIIDDETPAHKALASHIAKYDDLEHSGSAFSGMEALKLLNENTYDIIFLDINMPVISGVELMELQPNRPLTIVTTAYSDFALSAYENDAIDYLLKPISIEKFTKAITKAKAYFLGKSLKKENENNYQDKVLCYRVNGQIAKILLKDIIYIESLGNYMKLFSNKLDIPIIIYGSLSSIAKDIDSINFVQIHRSFIVNTHAIQSLTPRTLTMYNGEILPVGRKYQILVDNLNL
ncbi:LytTR family DNA-binding domain-containing protein [Flavobacterium sp. LS1R47]|uniref:LytTR family DNA-binding domain-containing protein n=1 Tax=Flavobacterium frigoritolerans TaxID=2987686 RepID=A0A9X2ZM19_9FLAO|nr:LytTR family DNA-binding domain-containing protein [Flavobacterium frigoritolerans]MCV9933504.1 LytTR family DNA-binding domain-containing protein [Flavobacterium frigoritolerans]